MYLDIILNSTLHFISISMSLLYIMCATRRPTSYLAIGESAPLTRGVLTRSSAKRRLTTLHSSRESMVSVGQSTVTKVQ